MSSRTLELPESFRQTLDRRHVYIFPTRHGAMLGAMMFVILLGSINYDNALGYLLTFLLFGLFLVGMLHTYRNLSGLSYLGAQAQNVFAGEAAIFVLTLDNRGHGKRFSVMLKFWPASKGWFKRRAPQPETWLDSIAANNLVRTHVRVPTSARGALTLQRTLLTSTFPLGILRAWAYFRDDANCVVYPEPKGHLPLPAMSEGNDARAGGTHTGNDDFAGLHDYRAGDPIRAIAWKSLARNDTVAVKRFTSGGTPSVLLRWSDCARLENTEARLSQLCAWILSADRLGLRYGLELPQQRFGAARGTEHREQCLTALALFH